MYFTVRGQICCCNLHATLLLTIAAVHNTQHCNHIFCSSPPTTNSHITAHIPQDKIDIPRLLCKYTVVLTTYGTLAMEAPAKPEGGKGSKKQQQGGSEIEEKLLEKVGQHLGRSGDGCCWIGATQGIVCWRSGTKIGANCKLPILQVTYQCPFVMCVFQNSGCVVLLLTSGTNFCGLILG